MNRFFISLKVTKIATATSITNKDIMQIKLQIN